MLSGSLTDLGNFVNNDAYIQFTPVRYASGEVTLTANLTAPDGRTGTGALALDVLPVASQPALSGPPRLAGTPNQTVPLNFQLPPTPDTDGSESTMIVVSGLKGGTTLSNGTNSGCGTWTLAPNQLPGLMITLPGSVTAFTLTATATVTDVANLPSSSCQPVYSYANSTVTLAVQTVNPPAVFPTVTGPATADVEEYPTGGYQQTTFGNYTVTDAAARPTDPFTVVIRADRGVINAYPVANLSVGIGNSGSGAVTLSGTLADIDTFLLRGFSYQPPDYYSGDARLTVDAIDGAGLTGSAATLLRVLPVASPFECVMVPAYITGNFGEGPYPIDVPISFMQYYQDTDGSESVYFLLTNYPPGTTFSAGNETTPGTWRVEAAQLPGLQLNPPFYDGTFTLYIEAHDDDTAAFSAGPPVTDYQVSYANTTITVPSYNYSYVSFGTANQTINEGGNATYSGNSGLQFRPADVSTVTVTLTAANGTIQLGGGYSNVSIGGDGSGTVTVSGDVSNVTSQLTALGFTFVPINVPDPTAPFRGEGTVTVQITNDNGATDYAQAIIDVKPTATTPTLATNVYGTFGEPSGATSLAGLFTAGAYSACTTGWTDQDGSEFAILTITLSGVPDPSLFQLTSSQTLFSSSYNSEINVETWYSNYPYFSTLAQVQAVLDSLVLTPPAGYHGYATLSVSETLYDNAYFPSQCSGASDTQTGCTTLDLRFFLGGERVTLPTVVGPEGQPVDLGNAAFVASDPDNEPYDYYDLTLSVDRGNITTVNPGEGGPYVTGSGTGTITLFGSLGTINQFLAGAGDLTYNPDDPLFSGFVPVSVDFKHDLGEGPRTPLKPGTTPVSYTPPPFLGTAFVVLTPVVVPFGAAAKDAATDEDTPVALALSATPPVDPAPPGQTVDVFVHGVPAGASLNHGTDLGGGTWRLTPAGLDGLTFTPAPDGDGVFHLTLEVVTTNPGQSDPMFEGEGPPVPPATASASAAFTVTVTAVARPPLLGTGDVVGNEGSFVPLSVSLSSRDLDGDDVLSLHLSNVPGVLSAGTFHVNTGVWDLTPAQLAGLQIYLPTHTGGQPVTVTVTAFAAEPSNGSVAQSVGTFTVTGNNVAPVLSGQSAAVSTRLGAASVVDFGRFFDPGDDPNYTVTIDWGDGTVQTLTPPGVAVPVPALSGADPTVSAADYLAFVGAAGLTSLIGEMSHTYAAAGSYQATVTVSDGTDSTTAAVPVTVGTANTTTVFASNPTTPVFLFEVPLFSVTTDATPTGTSGGTTTTTTPTPGGPTGTQASFGFIPGGPTENVLFAELAQNQFSLPALGSSFSTASATTAFSAGREKHPLPPVLPLDQTLPTAGFEGSGDSISLIDQLYRDATTPTSDSAPAPKANGGPSTAAPPAAPPQKAQDAPAGTQSRRAAAAAEARLPTEAADAEEGETAAWQVAAAVGLIPLLGAARPAGRRRPPAVRRWLRHMMFKPRTPART